MRGGEKMKLNEMAWANASAVLIGIVYLACSLLIAAFPELSKTVAQSWVHGIDFSAVWTGTPRGNFVLGLVTAVGLTWLAGWAFAWVYNKFSK